MFANAAPLFSDSANISNKMMTSKLVVTYFCLDNMDLVSRNKNAIRKLDDFVKVRTQDINKRGRTSKFYHSSGSKNHKEIDIKHPSSTFYDSKDYIKPFQLDLERGTSCFVERIGIDTPLMDVNMRSQFLGRKKSRNTSAKNNHSVMSASASRRRSRVENDCNYNSSNMRSFELLPHKGPIKVLQKISLASCSPIANSTKNFKTFKNRSKEIIPCSQIKKKLYIKNHDMKKFIKHSINDDTKKRISKIYSNCHY